MPLEVGWLNGLSLPSGKGSVPFSNAALPFSRGELPSESVGLPCEPSSAAYRWPHKNGDKLCRTHWRTLRRQPSGFRC